MGGWGVSLELDLIGDFGFVDFMVEYDFGDEGMV